MKNALIKTAAAAMVAASFGFTAVAADAKASPKTEKAAAKASSSKVGKALDGKVIRLKDGKAVEVASLGDPKNYVFYHSASW